MQWIVAVLGLIAAVSLVLAGAALKKSRDVGRSSRAQLCREEQKTRGEEKFLYIDIGNKTWAAIPPKQRRAAASDAKRKDPVTQAGKTLAFVRTHLGRLDRLDCGAIANVKP